MKVKFLRPVAGYAYFENDVAEIPDDKKAVKLVQSGYAIMVPETEGKENNLPEDLPAREILYNNGLETIVDVKKSLESLTDFDGIGKKTAENIKKYLK